MSFSRELKDFAEGYERGEKILASMSDRQYRDAARDAVRQEIWKKRDPGDADLGAIPDIFDTGGGSSSSSSSSRSGRSAPVDIKGDPDAGKLLAFIRDHEAGSNPYNKLVGGKTADLTGMTVGEVLDFQKNMLKQGHESTALGAYQFVNKTLGDAVSALKLDPKTPFDEATQDRLGYYLLQKRGWGDYKDGRIGKDQLLDNIAHEWAALPLKSGKSAYAGVGSNRAGVSRDAFASIVPDSFGTSSTAANTPDYGPAVDQSGNRQAEAADSTASQAADSGSGSGSGFLSGDAAAGMNEKILRVANRAARDNPGLFALNPRTDATLRTEAQQRDMVDKGFSTTMNSKHRQGKAVDLVPINPKTGQPDPDYEPGYDAIQQAMRKAARDEGVPDLSWGGDWKSFKDRPHWQVSQLQPGTDTLDMGQVPQTLFAAKGGTMPRPRPSRLSWQGPLDTGVSIPGTYPGISMRPIQADLEDLPGLKWYEQFIEEPAETPIVSARRGGVIPEPRGPLQSRRFADGGTTTDDNDQTGDGSFGWGNILGGKGILQAGQGDVGAGAKQAFRDWRGGGGGGFNRGGFDLAFNRDAADTGTATADASNFAGRFATARPQFNAVQLAARNAAAQSAQQKAAAAAAAAAAAKTAVDPYNPNRQVTQPIATTTVTTPVVKPAATTGLTPSQIAFNKLKAQAKPATTTASPATNLSPQAKVPTRQAQVFDVGSGNVQRYLDNINSGRIARNSPQGQAIMKLLNPAGQNNLTPRDIAALKAMGFKQKAVTQVLPQNSYQAGGVIPDPQDNQSGFMFAKGGAVDPDGYFTERKAMGTSRDARFQQLLREESRGSGAGGMGGSARDRAARRLSREEGRPSSTAYRPGGGRGRSDRETTGGGGLPGTAPRPGSRPSIELEEDRVTRERRSLPGYNTVRPEGPVSDNTFNRPIVNTVRPEGPVSDNTFNVRTDVLDLPAGGSQSDVGSAMDPGATAVPLDPNAPAPPAAPAPIVEASPAAIDADVAANQAKAKAIRDKMIADRIARAAGTPPPAEPPATQPQGAWLHGQWIPFTFQHGGRVPDAPNRGSLFSGLDNEAVGAGVLPTPEEPSGPIADQEPAPTRQVQATPKLLQHVSDALDGGVKFLSRVFGLKGAGAVPMPEDQATADLGARRMASGEGAATQDEITAIDDKIDPNRELSEGDRHMSRLAKTTQWYLEQGRKEDAEASAAALMQFGAQRFSRLGTLAKAAYAEYQKDGDPQHLKAAGAYLENAYRLIPDGNNFSVDVNPTSRALTATRTGPDGKEEEFQITPEQLPALIQSTMNSSGYWKQIFRLADPEAAKAADALRIKREETLETRTYEEGKESSKNEREKREKRESEALANKEFDRRREDERKYREAHPPASAATIDEDAYNNAWAEADQAQQAYKTAKNASDDPENDPEVQRLRSEYDTAASRFADQMPYAKRSLELGRLGFTDFTYTGSGEEPAEPATAAAPAAPAASDRYPGAFRNKNGVLVYKGADGKYRPVPGQ